MKISFGNGGYVPTQQEIRKEATIKESGKKVEFYKMQLNDFPKMAGATLSTWGITTALAGLYKQSKGIEKPFKNAFAGIGAIVGFATLALSQLFVSIKNSRKVEETQE